jgi:hypothetical protein
MATGTKTARQRVIEDLRAAGEDGRSKSELRRLVGGNAGAFRRLIQSMLDKEEVVAADELRPECGLTKVHRLGPGAPDA